MARPRWIKSLVAALASTGIALGQQPAVPTPAPSDPTGTVITVQEANHAAQKCIIVKTWTTKEGSKAYQVRAMDTGEVITIVEAGPPSYTPPSNQGSSSARSIATRIFHHGRDNVAPTGAPVPPEAVVSTTSASPTVASAPTPACECPPAKPVIVETEPAKKSLITGLLPKKAEPAPSYTTDDPKTVTQSLPVKTEEPRKPWIKSIFTKKSDDDKKVAKEEKKPEVKKVAKTDLPPAEEKKPEPAKTPEIKKVVKTDLPKADEKKAADLPPAPVKVAQLPAADPGKASMLPTGGPEMRRLPPPPPPRMPQAPQPNQALAGGAASDRMVPPNGFSTPDQFGSYHENNPSDRMINAFSPANPAPAAGGPGVLAPNYGPGGMMPPPPAMVAGRPAPMPAMPYSGPNQLAYATGMRAGQPPVMQAGGQAPAGYPSATAVVPAIWQQPVMAPQNAMPQAMTAPAQDPQPHLATLKDALYPSQREIAVEQLAKCDPRTQPHVVQAMAKGCIEDPAATVRAACVRCLVRMNVHTPEVHAAFQAAKSDKDPRVQHEADLAIKASPK